MSNGWLGDLLGYKDILLNGFTQVRRQRLNFLGSGVTIVDNPATGSTDVRINASGTGGTGTGLPDPTGLKGSVIIEDPAGTWTVRQLTTDDILSGFGITSFAKTAPNTTQLLYERGDTITGLAAAIAYTSGPPDSASMASAYGGSTDVGDVNPSGWATMTTPFTSAALSGSVLRKGSDLGADPTMTSTLTAIHAAVTKTASFTITWTRRVRWGVGAAGFNTSAQVLALAGSGLQANFAKTFTVNPNAQKLYFAYPKAYGLANQFKNSVTGFAIPFNAPTEISITANGVTYTVYLYESVNAVGNGSALTCQVS